MQEIGEALSSVRIGSAGAYRNLTIFPLITTESKAAGYITLDEALERKFSVITEISEGGSVPELKFVNSGALNVFLLDGEELVGAKQNRVINLSILVAAGKTLVIPVSCVEAGRWSHRGRHFASAPRAHYAEGRAMKMAQVSASMRATGHRRSNQSEVWRGISEKLHSFKVDSETSAVSDLFEKESAPLESYVGHFAVSEGQAGALFAIDGEIVGLDLFDAPETFRKLFPKLLRSYGLDALDRSMRGDRARKGECTASDAMDFLARVRDASAEQFPAVGEGIDIRLSAGDLNGAALASDGHIVHLSAFSVPNR